MSILPQLIRDKLQLGKAYDLTTADWLAFRAAGALFDRRADAKSPACQSSVRLGLPYDFLYKGPAEQSRLLEKAGFAAAGAA